MLICGFQKLPPEGCCKKGILINFVKFARKQLCQSLYSNKVAGLRPETLLKKTPWQRRFSVNFTKFLRIPFLHNTSGRLCLCFNISTMEFYPDKRTKQSSCNPSPSPWFTALLFTVIWHFPYRSAQRIVFANFPFFFNGKCSTIFSSFLTGTTYLPQGYLVLFLHALVPASVVSTHVVSFNIGKTWYHLT